MSENSQLANVLLPLVPVKENSPQKVVVHATISENLLISLAAESRDQLAFCQAIISATVINTEIF